MKISLDIILHHNIIYHESQTLFVKYTLFAKKMAASHLDASDKTWDGDILFLLPRPIRPILQNNHRKTIYLIHLKVGSIFWALIGTKSRNNCPYVYASLKLLAVP